MTSILALDGEISLEAGGGKCANLARVARAGFCVPPGFVIAVPAYREFVAVNGLEDMLVDTTRAISVEDPASLDAASAAIRSRFASASMPPAMEAAIRAAYVAAGSSAVAVRSSATTEDLPDLSFAGQQETRLNVVGEAALLEAVVACWSSLWTARAIGYRARNDIAHETAALAVLVQRMVDSEVSGVLFTANPLSGRRSETVIDATFGLGEALVSGRVEPDHYVVDEPAGRVLARHIGAKALAVRSRAGGGTDETDDGPVARPTLADPEVLELAGLGRRVAAVFGTPQDIEWALVGGVFHVLQSRPITSLFPLPGDPGAAGLRVCISVGAVQGMLDPITPLGRDVFKVILPRALASIGAPFSLGPGPIVVEAGDRLFLDVTALVQRPAVRARLRRVLDMVEPTTGEALDEVYADRGPWPSAPPIRLRWPTPGFLVLLARALGSLAFNLLQPDRGRRRAQRLVAVEIEAFERRVAAARTLAERIALLEHAFGWVRRTGLPVLGPAFGSGLANLAILAGLTSRLPDSERRVLETTRGLPHNVTTEMDLALWDVALTIRADPHATAALSTGAADTLARASHKGELPTAAQCAIDAFQRRYGVRGVGEIDIGRSRWRDEPTPLLQVLQSYLRIERLEQAPDAVFRRGAEAAERTVDSLIAESRRARFGRLRAWMVQRVARRMRALAGLRESPKFTMITMLGAVRASLLASGRELASAGVLEDAGDIFFLHHDELLSAGTGVEAGWRSLVAGRRQVHARETRRRRVPRVLLSDGRAFFGGGAKVEGATISGTPVSPGVSIGVVRVIFDPAGAQLSPGEILVCRGTDPAWTPLFLSAAGLVTEVGGLMTHGSVVAREYGIPAVVGVTDATTRFRTGDRVRVDGTHGTVAVLDP